MEGMLAQAENLKFLEVRLVIFAAIKYLIPF